MTIEDFEKDLQNLVRIFQDDMAKVRTGKVSPQIVEAVTVDLEGRPYHLNQLAHVAVQGNAASIEPWDESYGGAISDALQKTLNVNPQKDGRVIRVTFPPLTEETRRTILKMVSKRHEEIKIQARGKRDDLLKGAKRDKEERTITEDQLFRLKERADKSIEKFNADLERAAAAKEKEILG